MNKNEIAKLHYDKNAKGLFFNLLKFSSVFYAMGCEFKNFLYEHKILKPKKVDAYVISIGNLTTGGVGKTPVVAEFANFFKKDKNVAIVSRGYGSKKKGIVSDGKEILLKCEDAGDEPFWLAQNTNAVIITSPVRYLGAKQAVEDYNSQIIIADDCFQHRKFYRDLDIVLIDSEKKFGNNCLLPAGPLRECIRNIKRADKIIVISKNIDHTEAYDYIKTLEQKFNKKTYLCKVEPDICYNIFDEKELLNKKEKVVAFSGIGQPEQFYKFLKEYDVVKTLDFDDHHAYTQEDVKVLEELNLPLITTEKDAVKCKTLKFNKKVFALKLKTHLNFEEILKND